MKDWDCATVFTGMSAQLPGLQELRAVIQQKGFSVNVLAVHVRVGVRTLQRRFAYQFRTSPKAWIMRERMNFAPPLLAGGLSNKEVAASLNYTCESNFCRDFRRHFGCAPQQFVQLKRRGLVPLLSRFDRELARFDKCAELSRQSGLRIVEV